MEKKNVNRKGCVDNPAGRQSESSYVVNPIWGWGLSPIDKGHNPSNLYDSYELQAVTKQLNRAIYGGPLSPYSFYLKSSFYRKGLNCIRRENANTPKRISCAPLEGDLKTSKPGPKGFVMRLWKKVKHGLVKRRNV